MKKYWLKFQIDFFQRKEIKKLRRLPGGAEYVLVYLQMMLSSVATDGILQYEGYEADLATEVALDIDEDIQAVRFVVKYLLKFNLLIELSESQYALLEAARNIGSESESAERVRKFRERKKEALLQCNGSVTSSNDIKSREEADIDAEVETEHKEISDAGFTYNILELLKELKLSKADYKKMVKEYGENLVNEQLLVLKGKHCSIRNVGGMLRTACRENWHANQKQTVRQKSAAVQAIEMLEQEGNKNGESRSRG